MCGIAVLLHHPTVGATAQQWTGALEAAIAPRGPDQQGRMTLTLDHDWKLVLLTSVLHMRGPQLYPQPAHDEAGNVLLWNGEVFAGRLTEDKEPEARATANPGLGESDTKAVLQALGRAWEKDGHYKDDEVHHETNILPPSLISRHVRQTLANIQGPWAMIYYHKASKTVHYGRDRLGRRSLVMHIAAAARGAAPIEGGEWLAVASTSAPLVAPPGKEDEETEGLNAWSEVKVDGLWCVDLSSLSSSSAGLSSPQLVPWTPLFLEEQQGQQRQRQPFPTSPSDATNKLLYALGEAVRRRVVSAPTPLPFVSSSLHSFAKSKIKVDEEEQDKEEEEKEENQDKEEEEKRSIGPPARVAVLYSGGLDCQVLAALAHLQLTKEEEQRRAEDATTDAAAAAAAFTTAATYPPIDLINVCFDFQGGHRSPDRLAALAGWLELRRLFPSRHWRLLLVDIDDYEEEVKKEEGVVKRLILPCQTPMDFNIACAFWHAARGVGRVMKGEEEARQVLKKTEGEGLLRYGGTKEGAEEEGREEEKGKELPGPCSVEVCQRVFKPGCNERLCGHCCLKAQKKAFWLTTVGRGGEGNGMLEQQQHQQQEEEQQQQKQRQPCRVHKLGKSWLVPQTNPPSPTTAAPAACPAAPLSSPLAPSLVLASSSRLRYRSRARVVLLGIGADEQLAGYGRHRSTFLRGGEEALARELEMDMGRLWTR